MSLADYLAKNYLTADAPDKPSKKRKRKQKEQDTAGLTIDDDEAAATQALAAGDDNDDDSPLVVGSNGEQLSARKFKKTTFKTVGSLAPSDDAAQREADAQLAAAAAEDRARRDADDAANAPQVVGDAQDDAVLMSNGAAAGLQTADQVGRMLARRAREERRRFDAQAGSSTGKDAETVYRDASGRVINVAMARAEKRRAAADEERRAAEQLEATKGEVQRAQQQERAQQLADARYMTVARHADDAALNDELRARDRWDDPALGFLVRKGKTAAKGKAGKPVYSGSAAPNRHGVRPGYRWDGVDRSTGWEGKRFAAANRRQDLKNLQYAWQMDE